MAERQRHTTDAMDRRAAIERAVDQGIRILPLPQVGYEAYNPDANSSYALVQAPGGGYGCECPSALYRPYCKHAAALDIYFIEHRIDDSAHRGVVVVRLNGKEYRFGDAERREILEAYRASRGG